MIATAFPPAVLRRAGLALALLVAATLPLLAEQPPAAGQGDDPLVARVNERDIHLSDVYASIESLSLGDQIDVREELPVYIEAIINEEVLFQWALNNDSPDGRRLRNEIKDLVVRHLIERFVHSRIEVPEKAVRAYYDNNPSLVRGEHVRVRTILREERPECERLMRRIDSEEEFIRLAKEHSLDRATAANGGDSGLMMRGEGERIGHELEYFDMEVGEMRIFDTGQGCLLVRSVFYTKPPMPPYQAVRGELRAFLENRQERRLVERLVRSASRNVEVERFYNAR